MAEGTYYYDETTPITRSHNDVLHHQRLDRMPATYLVELPGTLPLPPPQLQTRETRRGISIVTMDQPTSEGLDEDEPLEAYLRTNLPSFRRSLAPEDLKDIRRARGDASGGVLVESKVESRLTPSKRLLLNESPADKEIGKTTLNDTAISKEIQPNEKSANKEMRKSPPNEKSSDEGIRMSPLKQKSGDKKVRKASTNKKPAVKEIRKIPLNDNPISKEIQPNEKSANKEMRKSPPNEKSSDEGIRMSPLKQKSGDKKVRKASTNKKPAVKEIRKIPLNDNPSNKEIKKRQTSARLERISMNNRQCQLNNVVNEKDVNRFNNYITAMPMLTEQGCPIALKGDRDFQEPTHDERRKVKNVVNERDVNRSNNYIIACPMLTEQRGPMAIKKKDFNKSRVKVHVMVDVLDDKKSEESREFHDVRDKFGKTREPLHNVNDNLSSHSNNIYTREEERIHDGERVQQRHHGRSWSVNSRRESIDRDNILGKPPLNSYCYNAKEILFSNNIGNGSRRVSCGQKHKHRSRSASIMRYSDDTSLSLSTTQEVKNRVRHISDNRHDDGKNDKLLGCTPLPSKIRSLKDGSSIVHKNENSFENDRAHISRRGREYGGYDGKRNDQSSKRNKTDKPFSYDGMINCDIKDCPCRCHPDYDHSNEQKIGRGLDGGFPRGKDGSKDKRDEPMGGRYYPNKGKGYDPIYGGELGVRDRPWDERGRGYPDGSKGKGYDPLYDGDLDGKGRPRDGRGRDFPDKTRGKGYDPFYAGDLDGKGRPKDGKGRDYPDGYGGKGNAPLYDGDPDGKGRPRNGRGRDYPDKTRGKGYDPFYDGDLDGKGRPKDGKGRDYPDGYGGKGNAPLYDGDVDGKGRSPDSRARRGDEGPNRSDKRDNKFDDYDDTTPGKSRRMSSLDGGPFGKTVGFRPGDPFRRDSTPGDGSNIRQDDDDGRSGVLKQRAPKSATSLFTHRRYHIKIPDHNLQEPWFNARFALDNEKNVDLKYQGPVKITNYYTSNRYE